MQTGPDTNRVTPQERRQDLSADSWCNQLSRPEFISEALSSEALEVVRRGVKELGILLNDIEFQERFLSTQTHRETGAIRQLERAIDKALIFKIKICAEKEVRASQSGSLNKKEVKAAAKLRDVVAYNDHTYDTNNPTELAQLREAVAKDNPHYSNALHASQLARSSRTQHAQATFNRLLKEFDDRKEDPELLKALELWGRSRNAVGETNEGRGYHAGVVHYFEYRAYSGKNKRYRNERLDDFSIQGFIDFTNSVKHIIRPRVGVVPEYGVLFRDEQGRKRLIARTESYLVIAFQHVDQPLRLLSLQPNRPGWRNREHLEDRIRRELAPESEDKRFNRLGKSRSLVASISSGDFLIP